MTAPDTIALAIALPPDYYRHNFETVLNRVQSLYSDLLNEREQRVLDAWPRLPPASQRLLVRLLTRKGPYFRVSKLHYPDVGEILPAADQLAAVELLELQPNLAPEQYLPLYTKSDCVARAARVIAEPRQLAGLKRLSRPLLVTALAELLHGRPRNSFCNEAIIGLTDCNWFEVFKAMFFGQPGQDLSEFVVRDLGHLRFETYQVDKSMRVFASRIELDSQLAIYRYGSDLEQALTYDAVTLRCWLAELPRPAVGDSRGLRHWTRIMVAGARQLERLGAYDSALTFYSLCQRPPARERRARILARAPATRAQALAVVEDILTAPLDEAEAEAAIHLGARLARQLDRAWPARRRYCPPLEKLQLAATGEPVESLAAAALSIHGPCFYVENSLFNTVFGLLYWPALFAPVRGAFSHPFQSAPLDLYDPDFCSSRRQWLAEVERQLANPVELETLLNERWRLKYGTACPFVAWDLFERLPVKNALETIPAKHWSAIFNRFLANLREHRSGLPDLILFPKTGGYRLLEIKAPGDRLQANQLRWMRYFAEHAIPHGVVQVEWLEGSGLPQTGARPAELD